MSLSFTRTLKFKVRSESYGWLNEAAREVNRVFNYCNETSFLAATRSDLKRKWLSGFDLCNLTSGADGKRLQENRFCRDAERKLAELQRRGHLRQAKRLHRKIRRRRQDACHKFSRSVIERYQNVYVGNVSSLKLARTPLAKGVLDSGWGMLKRMLQYKGEHAGRFVIIVNERNTTQGCSTCGALSGPRSLRQLAVRAWECACCGERHDRDVNAARNILLFGSRCRTCVSGNESTHYAQPPSYPYWVREAGPDVQRAAA